MRAFLAKNLFSWLVGGLTKEEVEDVVDFIELSSKRSQRETKDRLREEKMSLHEMEILSEQAG